MTIATVRTMRPHYRSLLLFLLATCAAHAQVELLLAEPFGVFGFLNPTGHAAIYLPHVCASTPTYLRHCEPEERGVVISRYSKIGGYDWIAMPLIPYLCAVTDTEQIPAFADAAIVARLRDQYRRRYLQALAPDAPHGAHPHGNWTQLVGVAYDRKIYSFAIESSSQQDGRLIDQFNSCHNKSHFNLLFDNGADFAQKVINPYYPSAVGRSFLADVGLTTPKHIAKGLVDYSTHHPELHFRAIVIPQVLGKLNRSKNVRGVFESLTGMEKYAAPLFLLYPFFASELLAGYLAS